MKTLKGKMLASSFIPFVAGAGVAVGGSLAGASSALAATAANPSAATLPTAKRKPVNLQLAACNPCNPCAAKNPCNPCAPSNPCNPCAAANPCNPCNPCAAGGGAVSEKCVVPRLAAASKSNPCAAKNPCNPCAAKNPCSPCAAANPCNPCGAAAPVDVTADELRAVYDCLRTDMAAAYDKAGLTYVSNYQSWTNVAIAPYESATHGGRYVNNYTNAVGEPRYTLFEEVGTMPSGSVLAKDSFVVNPNGITAIGPLFIMEKMPGGFDAGTDDWRYTMVMPNGSVFGTTGGDGSASVQFCAECHAAVAEGADSLFFLPGEFRAKF